MTMRSLTRKLGLFAGWAGATLFSAGFSGAQALDEFTASPDITIEIEAPSLIVMDEDGAIDIGGTPALADLGVIPGAADLSAYHLKPSGDQLFVLDITTDLGSGVIAEARDVVMRTAAGVYSIALDGSGAAIPSGARIDAVTVDPATGDIVISLDTTVAFGATTAADEDLVAWNGSAFTMRFDGSAFGIPASADVDAAHIPGSGPILVSFDTSGSLDGVNFDDEDVLSYGDAAGVWVKHADLSDRDADWSAADLDALHILAGFCGDASDDDFVDLNDASRIRDFLADPVGEALTPDGASKCSVVGGATDCNIVDWVVLSRAFPIPGVGPGIAPVCMAAF